MWWLGWLPIIAVDSEAILWTWQILFMNPCFYDLPLNSYFTKRTYSLVLLCKLSQRFFNISERLFQLILIHKPKRILDQWSSTPYLDHYFSGMVYKKSACRDNLWTWTAHSDCLTEQLGDTCFDFQPFWLLIISSWVQLFIYKQTLTYTQPTPDKIRTFVKNSPY